MDELIKELTKMSDAKVAEIFNSRNFTLFVDDFIKYARTKAREGYYQVYYPIPEFLKMIPDYILSGELKTRVGMNAGNGNLYIINDNVFLKWCI